MLMSNRSSNVGSDLIVVFRGTKDSVSGGAISMLYDLRKVDLLDSFKGMSIDGKWDCDAVCRILILMLFKSFSKC